MTIKITTPNGGSDSLDFGCAQTLNVAAVTGTEVSSGEGKLELKTTTGGTSATKVTVLANGNVGIGTTAPISTLDVNGGINLASTNLLRWSNAGTLVGGIAIDNSNNMLFNNTLYNTERMRITSAGNVGIGNASPNAKLDVTAGDGATAVNQAILSGGRTLGGGAVGGAGALLFTNSYWNANKGAALITGVDSGSSGGELTLSTTANGGGQSGVPVERMRIKQDGNIGIGTTAPTSKLQVAGDVDASAGVLKVGSGLSAHQTSRAILEYATNTSTVRCYGATAGTGNFAVKVGGGGGSTDTTALSITTTGDLKFNSGYGSVATAYGCRAWVNFNGTGTVAIRGSGNVSSITDNGTGNYRVNFATAMPDANYAVIGSTQGSGIIGVPLVSVNQGNDQTTSLVDIYTTGGSTGTATNFPYITVAVFR